ncbi:hypothetical protein D3C86_2037330 [compost metagenome]
MLSPMNWMGVLISWAMPEAKRPTASSFWAWRSSTSSLRVTLRSRTNARNNRSCSSAVMVISIGNSSPSRRRPASSVPPGGWPPARPTRLDCNQS